MVLSRSVAACPDKCSTGTTQKFTRVGKNQMINTYPLAELTDVNKMQCVAECHERSDCWSFSHSSDNAICVLFSSWIGDSVVPYATVLAVGFELYTGESRMTLCSCLLLTVSLLTKTPVLCIGLSRLHFLVLGT